MLGFSCDQQLSYETTPNPYPYPTDPSTTPVDPTATQSFKSFVSSRASVDFQNSEKYMGVTSGYFHFGYQAQIKDYANAWVWKYPFPGFSTTAFSSRYIALKPTSTASMTISSFPDLYNQLTPTQRTILEKYFNDMLNAYDVTTATTYYNNAFNSVRTSFYLKTESSKNVVRSIVEICHQYALKYFNGAYQGVASDVRTVTGTSFTATGRTNGNCRVDFKSVWRDAVLGGMLGGASGAYVGATGGTVVLPFVGTVTGGVAGAVFGFAAGFSGSAVTSVAGQVIWNCVFSSASYEDACQNPDWALKNQSLCVDRKAFYKLAI